MFHLTPEKNAGLRSLYKETGTGKHVVALQNYEEVRGKRLPWVRHVLEKSRSVFRVDENVGGVFRRTFLYTAISSIPLRGKAPQKAYFMVVVSEDGNRNFEIRHGVPS